MVGHEPQAPLDEFGRQNDARAGKLKLDALPGRAQRAGQEIDRRRADEPGDEQIDRPIVKFARRAQLLQDSVPHDRDAIGHRHRLDLVVGHVDRGDAGCALEAGDLDPHLAAQARVEIGQRLVHQESAGVTHQRPAHGDTLPLSARKLSRPALKQRLEFEHRRSFADAGLDEFARLPADLEREAEIFADGEMRVERIALENHRDVALARRQAVGDRAADCEHPAGDRLEAGDHAQRRRLAASGRPDQHQEFAVLDLEVEVPDRNMAARIGLVHI